MHELSITQNIIAIVTEKAGDRKVRTVTLEIGKLSAVVPDSIRFCFDLCAEGTPLEGASLQIDEVEPLAVCLQCAKQFALPLESVRCPCGSTEINCVRGQELNIKEMEVD